MNRKQPSVRQSESDPPGWLPAPAVTSLPLSNTVLGRARGLCGSQAALTKIITNPRLQTTQTNYLTVPLFTSPAQSPLLGLKGSVGELVLIEALENCLLAFYSYSGPALSVTSGPFHVQAAAAPAPAPPQVPL